MLIQSIYEMIKKRTQQSGCTFHNTVIYSPHQLPNLRRNILNITINFVLTRKIQNAHDSRS